MEIALPFRDRLSAGRELAKLLTQYRGREDVLVLALPRGGVPVAFPVAAELHAPLDVFVVRKLGVPGQEELAFGAITGGGVRVLNHDLVEGMRMPPRVIEQVTEREQQEVERQEQRFRGDKPFPDLEGKTVILVDDGLATGATMTAAAKAVQQRHPRRVVVAAPVAAPEICEQFRRKVDEVVCAATPEPFRAVGLWYEDFAQTTDEEVRSLLKRAEQTPAAARSSHAPD